jgi:hypothetical protein
MIQQLPLTYCQRNVQGQRRQRKKERQGFVVYLIFIFFKDDV